MVNTRAKSKKIQKTLEICFSQASAPESDHQSTQSAESVASNDDLLTEVICRVPARSILRFKSVSKQWLSFLSDSSFTTMFDKKLISSGIFFSGRYFPFNIENPKNTPPFRSLDFCYDPRGIRIVQSCNGLLLCCSDQAIARTRMFYVYNPTTKQFAVIPFVPGGPDIRKEICFMGLAFHPTECVDYKVVCIFRDEKVCRIQIYSSNTGEWKISNQSFNVTYDIRLIIEISSLFTCGVYWNGAIHWAPSCPDPLYFRLDSEQLQKLPLPSSVASSGGYNFKKRPDYFGESRGHLYLGQIHDHHGRHSVLNVYEMSSGHSGWFLKYQVELEELVAAYPKTEIYTCRGPWIGYNDKLEVLDIVRGELEGDTFVVVKLAYFAIIRYDFLNRSFKRLSGTRCYDGFEYPVAHRYIETIGAF